MIDINLVPENLRNKQKSILELTSQIPMDLIIGILGGVLAFLIIVHILLLGVNVIKIVQYKSLQSHLAKIKQEKEKVDGLITDMRTFQAKTKSIEGITSGKAILWSEKLNIISDSLAKGVWLSKIDLNDDELLIQGRALSRKNEQMINVHTFAANLKANARFLERFEDLDVGSIQLQRVGETEVANFMITCHLKK